MNPIEVRNVTKVYLRDIVANDSISVSIEKGEVFCLLGPNGAGKTTLVKQITTELKPSKGSIHIFGMDTIKESTAIKRRMGIMPQECGLFEHLTVSQHIRVFSRLKGVANLKESVKNTIRQLSLGSIQNKKVSNLSFGQKRQVLLAIALVGNPEILILDEPTTSLDPESKNKVWNQIIERKQRGTAVLLTTHSLEEAELLSDRLGFIYKGRLVHSGSVEIMRSLLKQKYEVRFKNGQPGKVFLKEYFDDLPSAMSFIEKNGLETFSLSTLPLEKIYFELADRK